ncbi:MAG: hypothetical protein CL569_08975 [Alphaproteobacteria bacterium]|nr:hypothetical protein [Alphaproteobacteria bacterium]
MRTLSHSKAKKFYDRFGARQDRSTLYEDLPIRLLIENSEFEDANSVLEFGCGTGRLAERLLAEHLTSETAYTALDISDTMIGLTRGRLAQWNSRVEVRQTTGQMTLDADDSSCDRFVSTYVFDLLSIGDIVKLLDEAHRVLQPDGLICLVSLTAGHGFGAKLATGMWRLAYWISPAVMGGCRPIRLWRYLFADHWEAKFRRVVCPGGLCSEILIARCVKENEPARADLTFDFQSAVRR